MADHPRRLSRFRGLWACAVGGSLLALLLWYLDPITRVEDCPNYRAAGNASAFSNAGWDVYLPLLCLGWLMAVIAEQFVLATSVSGKRLDTVVRAIVALLVTVSVSCFAVVPLSLVCR